MSADRPRIPLALRLLVAGSLGSLCGTAAPAEDAMPEPEFLEYLGSWEGSDDEWLLVEEAVLRNGESSGERNDPAPGGEESAETGDEHADER